MYWTEKGIKNTGKTIAAALARAKELEIDHIVVASNSGETALQVLEQSRNQKIKIVCVTHHVGYQEPGFDEMPLEKRTQLQNEGIAILTTTHILAGIGRAITNKFKGIDSVQVIAYTLRMFGQGTKVCVEVSTMALDAGLVPYGKEIIAIGGSGCGADTALVLTPAHGCNFFDTLIHEIICKPR